jgi:hypothetical protein
MEGVQNTLSTGVSEPHTQCGNCGENKNPHFWSLKPQTWLSNPHQSLLTQLSHLTILYVDLWCLKLLCQDTSFFIKCSGLVASMREPILVFTNMCDLTSYFKYKKFFFYWKTRKYAYLSYNTKCHHFYTKANNMCRIPNCCSSNGAVIITSLWVGKLSNYSSIQVQTKIFSFCQKCPLLCWNHQASYSTGTQHSFLTDKMARVWNWTSTSI